MINMCINQNANININAGMNGSFTFRKLLRKGIKELGENGISEKESDAKTLLEYVFNIDKATLYLDYDKDISDKEKIEK